MIFGFGESVSGYDIKVIDERAARAAAGILFLFGFASFFNAYLLGDFFYTKIFVSFFMLDFITRVLINPKYSPSLILGKYFVRYQKPEWVGAPQKRWAWTVGLVLSIIMFILIVILEFMTPVKIVICALCLLFLFSESVFGICIGCKLYQLLNKNPQYCSGESCTFKSKQNIELTQKIILFISIFLVLIAVFCVDKPDIHNSHDMKCQSGKCGASKF